MENRKDRPRLRVIQGTLVCGTSLGKLRIVAAPKDSPPFAVQAIAFEEDTFLVLSADPAVRDPKGPLVRIMTELMEAQPRVPGSVFVQGRSPFRLLAIIHDLNQEPSWKEEWILTAFSAIFEACETREIRSLALPPLGTVHGTLRRSRSIEMLVKAVQEKPLRHLKKLWLVVPAGSAKESIEVVESLYVG
ncbi:MAG: hypothetical protein AB1512_17240 [Thermodesulfobacteriota bacterium]